MRTPSIRALFTLAVTAFMACTASLGAAGSDPALSTVVASPARSAAAAARDGARHPVEELTFFGLKPTMTVVEIWPGSGYWVDILGPYLAAGGHYYIALPVPGRHVEEDAGVARLKARIAADRGRVGTIHETALGANHFDIAPPRSADLVLTFRNLHNWMREGYAEEAIAAAFTALKPNGIFGIEEHRGRNDKPQDPQAKDGYVRQDYTISMAQKAGFEFVGASEVNANPRDTKDWVDGVWTLPPTLSQKDQDRAKYLAIGEADNYVLKFRKPK
ncbi:MAG: methyltransferase [Pseudomonadota bacterium]|nr:methyltransferase [Pseudomonadota bacterium]